MALRRSIRFGPPLRVVGLVIGGAGLTLALPLLYALWLGEDVVAYLVPLLLAAVVFVVSLKLGTRLPAPTRREALLAAVLTWVGLAAVGVVPYLIARAPGGAGDPVNAFFESAAGFTATGATIMTDLDAQPRALLLWRAQTQWIGGIGLIVLRSSFSRGWPSAVGSWWKRRPRGHNSRSWRRTCAHRPCASSGSTSR